MSSPGFCTFDAGQAYESIPVEFVLETVDQLFLRAGLTDTTDKPIFIASSTRCFAGFGGRVLDSMSDRTSFWLALKHVHSDFLVSGHLKSEIFSLSKSVGFPSVAPLAHPFSMLVSGGWKHFLILSDGIPSLNKPALMGPDRNGLLLPDMPTTRFTCLHGSARPASRVWPKRFTSPLLSLSAAPKVMTCQDLFLESF
jgi:hypothetical protein